MGDEFISYNKCAITVGDVDDGGGCYVREGICRELLQHALHVAATLKLL